MILILLCLSLSLSLTLSLTLSSKPENILLAQKGSFDIRITDFGLSRMLGAGSFLTTLCGTPQYLAPEVLIGSDLKEGIVASDNTYDKAVDLWSLGCILYIL
jgi:serine/threonine protein kinase